MRGMLIRITAGLFTLALIGVSLALLIGRFTPAEMLTTAFRGVVLRGNRYVPDRTNFLLIDLNRHIRVSIPIPVEGVIETTMISGTGQEALLQATSPERHFYSYNLITDTLRELISTYTNPETGDVFQIDSIFSWIGNEDSLWEYDSRTGAVYRIDIVNNNIEHIVTLVDENGTSPNPPNDNLSLSISPSGTQVALIDHDMIYIFNVDGSNVQRYTTSIVATNTYGYWSQDGQHIYIYGSAISTAVEDAFRIFDVNTGEIVTTTQDLEGYTFSPCWLQSEWLAYVDSEDEGQLLNYQTGEAQNLSLHPELAGQPIEQILWLPDCDWVMVTIDIPNDNIRAGLVHQPIYIVSRDGQTVYFLGENVAALGGWLDSHTFLLAEAQGTEDIVYEVHLDGTLHRNSIGHFTPHGSWMIPLQTDPYHLLVYDNQSSNRFSGVSMLDLRSGEVETYLAPNELLASFPIQWLWN
jgi:hypothetical protein